MRESYESRWGRHFEDCSIAYRAWCVIALELFRAIPARWTFSKPALWLLAYAGHYANRDSKLWRDEIDRRTPPGEGGAA